MITLEQMVACAEREYNMRARVYPRWVASGKMSGEKALIEMQAMEAIWHKLRKEREIELGSLFDSNDY